MTHITSPLFFCTTRRGHLVGKEAEINKVSAKVINAMQALFQVTVPKISIIIRKSYGQAHGNMCGTGSGPDFVVAWPTAEIGFMDPEIAGDVVFGNIPEEEKKKRINEMIGDLSPYPAAGAYYFQDIIDPRQTRNYLTELLRIIRDSKTKGMSEHRLANWPTPVLKLCIRKMLSDSDRTGRMKTRNFGKNLITGSETEKQKNGF